MVTDGRVKELRRQFGMGRTLADSARMAEMSEKTARTYRDDEGLPSQTGREVSVCKLQCFGEELLVPSGALSLSLEAVGGGMMP